MHIILVLDNISVIPYEGKTIKYKTEQGEYIDILIDHICSSLNEVNSLYWYSNNKMALLTYVVPSEYFTKFDSIDVVLNSGIVINMTKKQLDDMQFLYDIQKKYLEEYDEDAEYATSFTDELVKIIKRKTMPIKTPIKPN